MKKLILSAAIILGGFTAVTAQTEKEATALNEQPQTAEKAQVEHQLTVASDVDVNRAAPEQDYKEIKITEIPQAVKDAIAKEYNGATISKAYVDAQGEYKLELTTADDQTKTVRLNGQGEMSKKELMKQ